MLQEGQPCRSTVSELPQWSLKDIAMHVDNMLQSVTKSYQVYQISMMWVVVFPCLQTLYKYNLFSSYTEECANYWLNTQGVDKKMGIFGSSRLSFHGGNDLKSH